jgi:probable selenium-dependent hydroxylase accessory protein YqeC
MKVNDLLDLNRGSIISLVGAGGKTSLMYLLAEELRCESKVLITTTTKIYMPEKEGYDYIAIGKKNFESLKHSKNKGIYLYGSSVNKENKIIGPTVLELDEESSYFHYIFVEADGAKGKAIKGWRIQNQLFVVKRKRL